MRLIRTNNDNESIRTLNQFYKIYYKLNIQKLLDLKRVKMNKSDSNSSDKRQEEDIILGGLSFEIGSIMLEDRDPLELRQRVARTYKQPKPDTPMGTASEYVNPSSGQNQLNMRSFGMSVQPIESQSLQYRLKFSAAFLMHGLTKQTELLYPQASQSGSKIILDYLLILKSLLLLCNIEKSRMESQHKQKEYDGLVQRCKDFINILYEEIKTQNYNFSTKLLASNRSPLCTRFVQKVLSCRDRTYSIFTLEDIKEIFEETLLESYEKTNLIYKARKTQRHMRLGILIFLCLEADKIFQPSQFQKFFDSYYIFKKEKLKVKIPTPEQIEDYILRADDETIIRHHRRLRELVGWKRMESPQ